MIFDCLGEYYKSQEQNIRQNFLLSVSTYDIEGIHELRVDIKRLRAFLHLIGHINPVFQPEKDSREILGLFKSAGKIRDIHVQQNMARENISSLNLEISEYINFLKEKEVRARKQFSKAGEKFDFSIFKKIWKQMRNVLIYISGEYIQYKSEERFKSLINELCAFKSHADFIEKDYHAIRILSKETRYTLDILQQCFPDKNSLQDVNDSLRGMHQALGKWHDYDIGLQFLNDFKEDFGDLPFFDRDSYVQYENYLQDEKTFKLDEFEIKWKIFLEMTQEAEC
ncbi:MAG: CHAD domain-containing protein [Candidatus Aminicenantes bacterium]|nr:CHAD domain-containing protein [Candidatus Aminicenantes bacterium]